MRVSSQASESTYVAQPPRDRGDWSWRAAQFASLRANAAQTEGGLLPLVDGLAAVEEPRWLALLTGVVAPTKGPAGREIRRVTAIRTLPVGQTRKVLRCQDVWSGRASQGGVLSGRT